MNLADNLKKIRKDNNLSQEDLADALGVSRQSVSKWESGAAYPEMDKMLQLCKMFNLNIDELLNQNIKEIKENKQNKNNINRFVDDFLDYITKTIDLFSSMPFKAKIKCIVEQIIIVTMIICALAIFGALFMEVINSLFRYFPEGLYSFFRQLIWSLYLIACLVLGSILVLYIFKIRYLDYYVIVDKEVETPKEEEKTLDIPKEMIKFSEKKGEKIIIRDPKNSGYKFISSLLKFTLGLIKCFVAFIALIFCFSLVAFAAGFAFSFALIKTGLTFIALIIMFLSAIVLNLIVLIVLYNFIISKKSAKKKLGIAFAGALLTFGIGTGLFISDLLHYEYIYDLKDPSYITATKVMAMNDKAYIDPWYGLIDYVEAENSDLKIEIRHSEAIDVDLYMDHEGIIITSHMPNPKFMKIIIEDLKNKKIIDYDEMEMTVYTTKENIEKLKANYQASFYYTDE